MSDSRQLAHDLIDRLPEPQLLTLVRFLESVIDPVRAALESAEPETEEISAEEEQAVVEARESLERNGGHGIPHADAMRRLGLD